MNTEKPKLTEEQVEEICAMPLGRSAFKAAMVRAGYMENPESALEQAERMYQKWKVQHENIDIITSWSDTVETLEALHVAVKEMAEKAEVK